MVSSVEMLSLSVTERDARASLGELQRAVAQATLIASDILAVGHPMPERPAVYDLNDAVRRALHTRTIFDTQIRLVEKLWPRPLPVVASPGELERIALGLVVMAFDAVRDGGAVEVTTTVEGWQVLVKVTDSAAGPRRILEPLLTTATETQRPGLTPVALIVRRLNGTMVMTSQPAGGLEVVVRLPRARDGR
jgi:C4-dicarboxylate-specific signal transduction histidine kinase